VRAGLGTLILQALGVVGAQRSSGTTDGDDNDADDNDTLLSGVDRADVARAQRLGALIVRFILDREHLIARQPDGCARGTPCVTLRARVRACAKTRTDQSPSLHTSLSLARALSVVL
jgi:hypothetical protein